MYLKKQGMVPLQWTMIYYDARIQTTTRHLLSDLLVRWSERSTHYLITVALLKLSITLLATVLRSSGILTSWQNKQLSASSLSFLTKRRGIQQQEEYYPPRPTILANKEQPRSGCVVLC